MGDFISDFQTAENLIIANQITLVSFLTTVHADLLHKWPISWCHLLMSLTMQIKQTTYANGPLFLPI